MQKLYKLYFKLFILIILLSLTSCQICIESYKNSGVWTPDSFGYKIARNRETGVLTDEFALTWKLK